MWQFVPCRDPYDYDVCEVCCRVLRGLAHVIDGEGEEDRPHPTLDDHFERAAGSALLCGGAECEHPPSSTRCDSCLSRRLVVFSAKCSDQFQAMDLGAGRRYDPSCYVPYGPLGGGDFVQGSLCLDCGKWQGKFPQNLEDEQA